MAIPRMKKALIRISDQSSRKPGVANNAAVSPYLAAICFTLRLVALTPLLANASIFTMQRSSVRQPAVAGRFYPSDRTPLTHHLEQHLSPRTPAEERLSDAKACIVPHAGYMYSGNVAGAVYRRLPAFSSYIILGPNHFGRGKPLAVSPADFWETPLGAVALDGPLTAAIEGNCPAIEYDEEAHAEEHSLEVQLPFLQHEVQDFSIVPIAIGPVGYETLEALGRAVAGAVKTAGRPVMIIASSDMSHYEPDAVTRVKDRLAIDQILALEPGGLLDVLRREQISMCGYAPALAMLVAARLMGAREAALEKYATSADAGGSPSSVVGYAGVVLR